jgi:gamma-tubulin complex component 2
VLLSIEGKYIRRKEDLVNNRYTYVVVQDAPLDSSLVLMVSNILPLCEYHDRVLVFIHKYSTFDNGIIFQALANAVKSVRRDYVVAINALDQEFQKGHFTLQRMWYETQKPQKIFEYLCKILADIEGTPDESLLTVLYKHLLIATDGEIHQLVYFLLQQAIFPFLEMLGKWIYYGIVDDKFNEFMIVEQSSSSLEIKGENFDWMERFSLNPAKVA